MEDADLTWRTASYSSNGGGNCVEVAGGTRRVLIRDTQDRTGPVLRFGPAAWRSFADRVKRSLASGALQVRGRPVGAPDVRGYPGIRLVFLAGQSGARLGVDAAASRSYCAAACKVADP